MRFSFIRELVYGSDESGKKASETSVELKSVKNVPVRRSSRLRERQNKNQHGQL